MNNLSELTPEEALACVLHLEVRWTLDELDDCMRAAAAAVQRFDPAITGKGPLIPIQELGEAVLDAVTKWGQDHGKSAEECVWAAYVFMYNIHSLNTEAQAHN